MSIIRVIATASLALGTLTPATADPLPVDPCLEAAGDAEPGTPEFAARDALNVVCTEQRRIDQAQHPVMVTPSLPTSDAYRAPQRHDGQRFRFQATSVGNTAAELYLPCALGTCSDMPPGLSTFEPPYPGVIVHHGGSSRKEYHWWSSQTLAEAGYMVLAVDTTGGQPGILDWFVDPDNSLTTDLDRDRVGIAGHSAGGASAAGRQGDPRISAIIVWDGVTLTVEPGSSSTVSDDPTHVTPTLYLYSDGGFASPVPRTSVPGTPKSAGFAKLRARGADTMSIAGRATTHLDFVGGELMGNRYAELLWVYYDLAWFDRYVKGALVLTGDETPAEEAAERALRQEIAQDAFDRLTAEVFDDTADTHNISQGFWDPVQAALSGDPLYGGNVPYALAGKVVRDRLSFYYRSVCFVSVPDYESAASGSPGSAVVARADTTPDGDMRTQGCTPHD